MASIKVSAIVSTYNAEKFFRSRIENLLRQTIAEQMEIIVIDSGSTQNESKLIEQYLPRFGPESTNGARIKFLRTERETLYASWNRGVELSSGDYLTNANTDDRLLDTALETMADKLDANPDVSLVYSDAWETTDETEILDCEKLDYKPGRRRVYQPEFSHKKLLLHCYCGPFPMWRRSAHDRFGKFDPNFVVAGDWEFWLRMAESAKFAHIDQSLGLMLKRDDSIVWSNQEKLLEENNILRRKYFGQPQQ